MSNVTDTIASPGSFNIMYPHWSEGQYIVYGIESLCINNALYAFVAVLTQFAISQWIWSSKAKSDHNSPVYLVSFVVFAVLFSLLNNGDYYVYGIKSAVPIGIRIAVPILAYGGVLLNLLFYWIWSRVFSCLLSRYY